MKIGIYNRYWNTYGGGEKYAGAIAQFMSKFGNVDLVAHEPFSIPRLERRLNLKLAHCKSVILTGEVPGIEEDMSSNYDLWINITFQSESRSRAKRSILIVMFPFLGAHLLRKLWKICPLKQPRWIQRIFWKEHGFWLTYDVVLSISSYTQHWVNQWWGVKSDIIVPPIDIITYLPLQEKKKIILSVGRFFKGGHNKKQDVMVMTFMELYDSGGCPGWEYHLCGGTHPEAVHQAYIKEIIDTAKGYPVFIHPDIERSNLEILYREASIFWHASGYGEDEKRHPEQFEHFGITTVEAMSAACIPVVIAKGGQKEIVQHEINGCLWNTLNELKNHTVRIINDPVYAGRLREQATKDAAAFSYDIFSKNLTRLLKQLL